MSGVRWKTGETRKEWEKRQKEKRREDVSSVHDERIRSLKTILLLIRAQHKERGREIARGDPNPITRYSIWGKSAYTAVLTSSSLSFSFFPSVSACCFFTSAAIEVDVVATGAFSSSSFSEDSSSEDSSSSEDEEDSTTGGGGVDSFLGAALDFLEDF